MAIISSVNFIPSRRVLNTRRRGFIARGFTLVELLVVVSIIALLIAILLPSLKKARQQGKGAVCLSRLRTLGQGMYMYAMEYNDQLVPCRLPKLDSENWRMEIKGGLKYRPTFLAILGSYVGVPAFDDPQPEKNTIDRYGESGDRQDYSNDIYVCPSVARWVDERNGCYGYNYHFLGNARLKDDSDPTSFKKLAGENDQREIPGGVRCGGRLYGNRCFIC